MTKVSSIFKPFMYRIVSLALSCVHCLMIAHCINAAEPRNKQLVSRFESLEWNSKSSTKRGPYRYRLYKPANMAGNERLPLLVWLHGEGYPGDTKVNLNWLPLVFEAAGNSPQFFILSPARPEKESWFSDDAQQPDALSVAFDIVEHVLAKYPIDPNRVYLTGVSSGGSACWVLASRHPERFAAVAPLASDGGNPALAAKLASTPIWAFHQGHDTVTPPEGDREIVSRINQAGGHAHLTETEPKPGATFSHNCWSAAFENYDLLNWLLDQRLGASESQPPAASIWARFEAIAIFFLKGLKEIAWITLPWIGLIACVRFFWLNEMVKRKKA